MAATDDDRYFQKFLVIDKRTDKLVNVPTFTLIPSRDPHARVALRAYADSIEREAPKLADDLRALAADV